MKIKEQTRKLVAGCTWVRQDDVDVVWRDFRRVLENADECLHAKTSQDDSNPAKGSKKNGFSTGFDHSNEVGFETDSAHGHDDEEFGELFERWKEAIANTKRSKDGS